MVALNPALTRRMTPPVKDTRYVLHLPPGSREAFALLYPGLEKTWSAPEPTRWVHRVRKGETVSSIAARYGVSAQEIRSWNRLGKRKLRPGRTLTIYGDPGDSRIASEEPSSRKHGHAGSDDAAEPVGHRVRSGETLASIAARYHVSVASIKSQNRLKSDRLRPGQKLRIVRSAGRGEGDSSEERPRTKERTAAAPKGHDVGTSNYRVHKGDSIYSIARKSGASVDEILKANGMKSNRIRPGQLLKIPSGG
jgi:membrane-bound lytic murein transglycosylase D